MAEENIDNTVSGSGLFNTKIPGLSDAADIQAALRLYHYGSYTYDGANTNTANLLTPSIAKHLQNLVDAIATHNADTTDVHGIPNTALLATKSYVDSADVNLQNQINNLSSSLNLQTTITTKTDSFSLALSDAGKTILLASLIAGSPIPGDPNPPITMTLTVPNNTSVAIPVGYQYNLIQFNYGRTIFTPASGVTVNSKNGQMWIDEQYGKATL